MNKLVNHSSAEKQILTEVFNTIPQMDSYWISTIVENYLYASEVSFKQKDGTIIKLNKLGGKYHGKCEEFYPTGQLRKVCFYQNGRKEGECLTYFKNGNLQKKKSFVNGYVIGNVEHYYITGEIRIRTHFNEKGRDEDVRIYEKTGDIIESIPPIIHQEKQNCSIM